MHLTSLDNKAAYHTWERINSRMQTQTVCYLESTKEIFSLDVFAKDFLSSTS